MPDSTSAPRRPPGRWSRPCATRCWPAASGSAPCSVWQWRSAWASRSPTILPFAAALELIHTYSLIHDDLPAIDDDSLRRGLPTCHIEFGEDVAILAGDGLFAEAFRLITDRQQGEPARLLGALSEVARATGVQGMVGGQYMDVAATATTTTSCASCTP